MFKYESVYVRKSEEIARRRRRTYEEAGEEEEEEEAAAEHDALPSPLHTSKEPGRQEHGRKVKNHQITKAKKLRQFIVLGTKSNQPVT